MEYTIKKVLIRSEGRSFSSPRTTLPQITWTFLSPAIYRQGIAHSSSQVGYFIRYSFFAFLKIIVLVSSCLAVPKEDPLFPLFCEA